MGFEQANNWRARRTNSIKLRTSDRKRHEVAISQGEGETDPVKVAAMQARREAARAALAQRDEAAQRAKRRELRETRADTEHALRGEQKPRKKQGASRHQKTSRQIPTKAAKTKREPRDVAGKTRGGESEEARLAKALERLREKYQ